MKRKILLSENEFIDFFKKVLGKVTGNGEIKDFQKELKNKGYDLGKYGPNKDGIDGRLGLLTFTAAFKEFLKNPEFKQKYGHLIPNVDKYLDMIRTKIKDNLVKTKNDVKGSFKGGDVILLGGLDYRPSDKKIDVQAMMVKNNLPKKGEVIGHRYFDVDSALKSLEQNPNAYVILFSAGCKYADKIASNMKDKTKLYIVEPYAVSSTTKNSVKSAVNMGVPESNVIVGPSAGRGNGVVYGATKTPSGVGHWGALEYAASSIS